MPSWLVSQHPSDYEILDEQLSVGSDMTGTQLTNGSGNYTLQKKKKHTKSKNSIASGHSNDGERNSIKHLKRRLEKFQDLTLAFRKRYYKNVEILAAQSKFVK